MQEKRIVFEHTQGPFKGLYEIMGTTAQFGEKELPTHAEGFQARGRLIEFASLVEVTPRYARYREVLKPGGKAFDEKQQ